MTNATLAARLETLSPDDSQRFAELALEILEEEEQQTTLFADLGWRDWPAPSELSEGDALALLNWCVGHHPAIRETLENHFQSQTQHDHGSDTVAAPSADRFRMPASEAARKRTLTKLFEDHDDATLPQHQWVALFAKEQPAYFAQLFSGEMDHLHYRHIYEPGYTPDDAAVTMALSYYIAQQAAGMNEVEFTDGRIALLMESISPHLKPMGGHYDDLIRLAEHFLTGNTTPLARDQGPSDADIHNREAYSGAHVHSDRSVPEIVSGLAIALATALASDQMGNNVPYPARVLLETTGAWPTINSLLPKLQHGWKHAKHGEHMEGFLKPFLSAALIIAGIAKKEGSEQLYAGLLMNGILDLTDNLTIQTGDASLRAIQQLEDAINQLPVEATLNDDDQTTISVDALQPDMHEIVLQPGDVVPVDSRLLYIQDSDADALTVSNATHAFGEDHHKLDIGAVVPQGVIVEEPVIVSVAKTYEDSSRVQQLRTWESDRLSSDSLHSQSRSLSKQIGNVASYGTAIGSVVVGLYHLISPLWRGIGIDPANALERMTSFATVASPCQILVAPFIETAFANKMMQHGVWTLNHGKQQKVTEVTDYCLDWSGTCDFNEVFQHIELFDANGQHMNRDEDREHTMQAATMLSLATQSDHPMQQAIRRDYVQTHSADAMNQLRAESSEHVTNADNIIGQGLSGMVNGQIVRVGRLEHLLQEGEQLPEFIADLAEREAQQSHHKFTYIRHGDRWGVMRFNTELRPDIVTALKDIAQYGNVHITTGIANRELIYQYTDAAGIPRDNVHTNIRPEGKVSFIETLKAQKTSDGKPRMVMFVGDGENDQLAFKAADITCALRDNAHKGNLKYTDFLIDHPGLIPVHRRAAGTVGVVSLVTTAFATAYTAALSAAEAFGLTKLPILGAVLSHEVLTGAIPVGQNMMLDHWLLNEAKAAEHTYALQPAA